MIAPFLLALLPGLAEAAPTRPAGDPVEPSVFIDVQRSGFDQIDGILRTLLPDTIPIDGITEGDSIGGGFAGIDYEFGVSQIIITPRIDNVVVTPTAGGECRVGGAFPANGFLDIDVDTSITMTTNAYVEVDVDLLWGLIGGNLISENCNIFIDQAPVTVDVDVIIGKLQNAITCQYEYESNNDCTLTDPNNPNYDCPCVVPTIEVSDLDWTLGVTRLEDLNLQCTAFVDVLLTVADALGLTNTIDVLIESIKPTIDVEIEAALSGIQPQIDEAMQALFIQTEVDLLGNPLAINVCPTDVLVTSDGMRMTLGGQFVTDGFPDPCIAPYDAGGSIVTIPPNPPLYPLINNTFTPIDRHFGAMVNDDFLNQALYEVWRGGLLCQAITADTSPVDLPIPLDSSLLDLLAGGQFTEFFTEPTPLILATRPQAPPIARTIPRGGSNPNLAVIEVADLGIDLYAELDGRMARFAGLDMQAQAELGADFNEATGEIGIVIDFDPATITTEVIFNDLKPEASAQIATGFTSIIDTVAGPLLNDLLAPITFAIPSFEGIGVLGVEISGAGPIEDWLGLFGNVGLVDYGSASVGGCDLFGGSSSGGGCDLGCASSPAPTRMAWLLLPLLVALQRRRS